MYVSLTDASAAVPTSFQGSWSVTASTDRADVTAQGDTVKVYVAGLPDFSIEYSGFLDAASPQFYTAATDGLARKVYLYPDTADATKYWFGTAFFDHSSEFPVDDSEKFSGSASAASAFVA